MTRIPMPSPRGTNHEGLYLVTSSPAMTHDSARGSRDHFAIGERFEIERRAPRGMTDDEAIRYRRRLARRLLGMDAKASTS